MAVRFQGGKAVKLREDFSSHLDALNKVQIHIAKVNSELYALKELMNTVVPSHSRTMSKLRRLNVDDLRRQLSDVATTAFAEAKPPLPFG